MKFVCYSLTAATLAFTALISIVLPTQAQQQNCDPAYPDLCIPVGTPHLSCNDLNKKNFRVVGSDTYGFDRDGDGIGCESHKGLRRPRSSVA